MAKTLLEKMFLKAEYKVAFLYVPKDLQSELETSNEIDTSLKDIYTFILSFYTQKNDLEKEIAKLRESLQTNGILWIAYPKGKALQTDLNRDILHETAKHYGLDGVSLISLGDIWSAMRFKKL